MRGARHTSFREHPFRNRLKSLGCACDVALRATEAVPFGPFRRRSNGHIRARSVPRTPFQTVFQALRCIRLASRCRCSPYRLSPECLPGASRGYDRCPQV
jgi:hypothetical protein